MKAKVGDLVTYESAWTLHNPWMKYETMNGIVTEILDWESHEYAVLWDTGEIRYHKGNELKVITICEKAHDMS